MAFANLFTRLSAVEEDVRSPGDRPAFPRRNETEGGDARKRKTQAEQTGPYKKKLCYQDQKTRSYNAASFSDGYSKARHYHVQNTDSEHTGVGFTKEVMHNHSYKADHNGKFWNGQNNITKKNQNFNKQRNKMLEGQNNLHQQKNGWRSANRGGNHQTRPTWGKDGRHCTNDKQDIQVRQRFMSQEFKDQNGVLVNGRLICRHFLWGRCIKDGDCQLEHVTGYNDLVKEVCKFYVQGLCTKGESCPYMHKSFPCKFFHKKGKCFQGADCKFSHEPLNDVTKPLLDETLKRDDEYSALAKKAEQESSEQPVNTDEPEISEANKTSDTLQQLLRPNFYNSAGTNAEKETSLCPTEELTDVMEGAVPPHASDTAHPHTQASSNIEHEEPVCYSVAAVLGPQLFKPFPTLFTSPRGQESGTSGSPNKSQAPYSVDAVLRSCKSVGFTFGHIPTSPPAQTASCTPKTECEENTDSQLSSETQDEKVLYSANSRNEVNKSQERMFKSLSSLQVRSSPFPKKCPNLTLSSKDSKEQGGTVPESLKSAQTAAHEVKLEVQHSASKGEMKRSVHLPVDITYSANRQSQGAFPFRDTNRNIFSRPLLQTSTSNRISQSRPHLSVLTSASQASTKPFPPSPAFAESKGGATVPAEPVTCSMKKSDSANKQPSEIHLQSEKTQSGLKRVTQQHSSSEITAERSSKTAHCGDLSVGRKKIVKRPFQTLFASPITDTLQPIDNGETSSSSPQAFIHTSCSPPQPADCKSNCVQSAVDPDKASTSSLRSLFAAPLSSLLPRMQSQPDFSRTSSFSHQSKQSVNNPSRFSNSKQRATDLETPLPRQVRAVKDISCAPRSPNFSPNPKIEHEDRSTEHVNQPTNQPESPASSLMSDPLHEKSTSPTPRGNSPSTTRAGQQLPDILSHKGSAAAATADSVLKTLFLCLSPYQQDPEQRDDIQMGIPSDSRLPDQRSTEKSYTLNRAPALCSDSTDLLGSGRRSVQE